MKKLFHLLWASEDFSTISICVLDLYPGIFMRLNNSFKISASPPFLKKLFMCCGDEAAAAFFPWLIIIIIILLLNFDVLNLPKKWHLKSYTGALHLTKVVQCCV